MLYLQIKYAIGKRTVRFFFSFVNSLLDRKTKIEIKFCISIFKFFQVVRSLMGESENLHCEHDIRNEHVRYSTHLSTKTPRRRISKYRKTKIEIEFCISIFNFFQMFLSLMGESEHLQGKHDIRNEHVCYSTNLSTKTPSGRISKDENRTNFFF